ncbi:MAG: molybdenum cofactor guanylyltransferase [Myxococcota bacterium]|jgi:molybdopterin-guanine dinucleotide biosynthesis protein A
MVPVKEGPPLTFVVQAGGKGTRLGGVAKGLIQLDGERLIERLLRLGAEWPCWVVANEPGFYADLDVPVVADVVPGRGAPGGVVTSLAVAATEWVLNVACDMPFVTRAAIDRLLAATGPDVDVVCFQRGGRLEPLLALYRRSLRDGWAARLDEHPSLQALLRAARHRALVPDEPRVLDSLNTPDELARAGASLR